jgi:hypothetical protein
VPAASALAAGEAGDDAELLRLAADVKAAWEKYGDAIDVFSVAEKRLWRWRDASPEPDRDSADWFKWLDREVAYGRASGFDEADAATGVASDKLTDAVNQLCDTRARSLRGLSAKARLCEIDPEALGQFLTPSIIDDLLALDADHV